MRARRAGWQLAMAQLATALLAMALPAASLPATARAAEGAAGAILVLHRVEGQRAAGGAGAADERGAVVGDPATGETERALMDALRIYTRDLGCRIVDWPGAPQVASSAGELLRVTSLGQDVGAELVVWLSPVGDAPTLYALRVRDGRVHRTPVGADDVEVVARTLALKVRSLYTRPPSERPPDWVDVPITPLPPREPAAAVSASVPDAVEPRPRRLGVELGLYGQFESPPQGWLRWGGVLRAGLLFPRTPMSVEIDGALITDASQPAKISGPGGTITSNINVKDVPLGLSGWARFERGPVMLAIGLRASLHILQATAQLQDGLPPLTSPTVTQVTAGLGIQAALRYQFDRSWALALLGGAELLVPEQVFAAAGATAPSLGGGQFFVSLGPVWRAY